MSSMPSPTIAQDFDDETTSEISSDFESEETSETSETPEPSNETSISSENSSIENNTSSSTSFNPLEYYMGLREKKKIENASVNNELPKEVDPNAEKKLIESLTEILPETEEDLDDYYLQKKMVGKNNAIVQDLSNLKKAKFKMINGDIGKADFYLNRLDDKTTKFLAIKKRYQAITAFLQEDFEKSLEALGHPLVNNALKIENICLLRLLNLIALNKTEQLIREGKSCQFATSKYSKNDQYWLVALIGIKSAPATFTRIYKAEHLPAIFTSNDASRIWLKTGLYLNHENDVLKLVSSLNEDAYKNRQIREVIAFIYSRLHDNKKALAFIDDIDSPNAENIKGNIRLKNKEYELAFGHFKLALAKKEDSQNAIERALPLSWILGQWRDGLDLLQKVKSYAGNERNIDALKIAFLIRDNKLKEAQKELNILFAKFKDNAPFEVHLMNSYVNLILEKDFDRFILREERRKIEDSIENSCIAYDALSCWLALQYLQWDNFGKTIHRQDPIYASDDTLTIDSLKQSVAIEPLDEDITIDQKDIEELDGSLIKILPSSSH